MKIEEGLYYSKDHEWVRVEDDKAYIGITDFAHIPLVTSYMLNYLKSTPCLMQVIHLVL